MYTIRYIICRQLNPYFQSLYGVTDVYELKGLHITKYDITASNSVKDVLNTPSKTTTALK